MGAAARGVIGPLTPKEVEEVLEELPARKRAALEWALGGVRQAIDMLYVGRLTEVTIMKAAAQYAAAIRPIIDVTETVALSEPAAYRKAIKERLDELGPKIRDYLGPSEHAARLARTLWAMFLVGALAMRELAAHPDQSQGFFDRAMDVDLSSTEGAGIRASLLVAAVLDAAEQGGRIKRTRALIERADLEGWVIANLLASEEIPGGPIFVPGYEVGGKPGVNPPRFKTELARQLWEQRQRVVASTGGTLTDAEVEAEVTARRGGAGAEC